MHIDLEIREVKGIMQYVQEKQKPAHWRRQKKEIRLIGCRWKKLAATTKSMVNIMIGSRIYFLNRTYKQLHMIEHNARKSDHAYVF